MEISEVKRQLADAIERAKRSAADRRASADQAFREYSVFLEQIAVPLFRQVANVLKVQGYPFAVFTPGGGVRLMSEKNADDFIELSLDTTGAAPIVMGHSRRSRGRRVFESERPVAEGPVRSLTDETVLRFLLEELEQLVEK